jgi:hypothetical protein
VRVALGAVLVTAALLTASCGSGPRTTAHSRAGPAPSLEGVELRGSIPGKKVEGRYRDEEGRAVIDVHRLLVVGAGDRRVALLLGRTRGTPCVGAVSETEVESARLDCFESFENPPLVVRVVVGGETRRRTDWLAVLVLARSPTARLVLESQKNLEKVPLTIRSWSGFAWHAFGAVTSRGALGNQLAAFDQNGEPVVRVELSWSYNPPCLQNNEDVCGANRPSGPWAEVRDPVRNESGAGEEDLPIAFAHPAVRRLLAGQRFFVNATAAWDRCDGSPLGSIVSFRVWPPVSFRGEIPYHDYAKDGENVAYREGRAYVEAERIASVEAWVDHRRARVVGIELDAFDATEALEEQPRVRITKLDMIEKPAPAGGPDDADQCPKDEPGE